MAATAIGSYFGYPQLGSLVGGVYGNAADGQGGGQAVASGEGVQQQPQKQGIASTLGGALGNVGGAGKELGGGGAAQSGDNTFALPKQDTSGWQEGIPANGSTYGPVDQSAAMGRRSDAMDASTDHVSTLQSAKDSLGYMPDDMRKMYEPAIDKALYQAQQRPAGSTAPTNPYIQNRRYGG
jgi:hypothetical protein